VKLYSGTPAKQRDSILAKGLVPRGKSKGNWDKAPSRTDMVYLTTAYPFYFASCHGDNELMVVEVETDRLKEDRFYPDEDFIAEALSRKKDPESTATHLQLTTLAKIELAAYRHHWQDSITCLGNCCYRGVIPPAAFTRYCILDLSHRSSSQLTNMILDPAIMTSNYGYCGWKYRAFIEWAFGDSPSIPSEATKMRTDIASGAITIEPEEIERLKGWLDANEASWVEESKDRSGLTVVTL
jgi:hypothetical protein